MGLEAAAGPSGNPGHLLLFPAETQKLWQSSPEKLRQVGVLTLYAGGYVRLTLHDLSLDFAIGEDAAAHLAGYLA